METPHQAWKWVVELRQALTGAPTTWLNEASFRAGWRILTEDRAGILRR